MDAKEKRQEAENIEELNEAPSHKPGSISELGADIIEDAEELENKPEEPQLRKPKKVRKSRRKKVKALLKKVAKKAVEKVANKIPKKRMKRKVSQAVNKIRMSGPLMGAGLESMLQHWTSIKEFSTAIVENLEKFSHQLEKSQKTSKKK